MLKFITGLIFATLGGLGIIVVMFYSSPAVSTLFLTIGFFAFLAVGSYGMKLMIEDICTPYKVVG